jgi:hypothetical protein
MSDEANIVVFRPASEYPIHKREKKRCKCSNVGAGLYSANEAPHVWVDEATRDLECRTCGARLDPFDYIWLLATEGDLLTRDTKRLREEKQSLKAQVHLLHEQIKALSTNRRRLAKDQSIQSPLNGVTVLPP